MSSSWLLYVSLSVFGLVFYFFLFKQKTAYEMRISDWSSDVCSSDLGNRSEYPDVKNVGIFRSISVFAPAGFWMGRYTPGLASRHSRLIGSIRRSSEGTNALSSTSSAATIPRSRVI